MIKEPAGGFFGLNQQSHLSVEKNLFQLAELFVIKTERSNTKEVENLSSYNQKKMILPNYYNGSIVNLTSSILKAFNINSLYSPLKELDILDKSNNIILLVIDGLGYEFIKKYGKNSIFEKYLIRKLTSVFPATTASAITTLETGVAPQQHGITGWYMLLKELGVVSTILPFIPRYGGISFPNSEIERKDIFLEKRLTDKINDLSYIIYPKEIIDGKVNKRKNTILTYNTLNGLFLQINKAIRSSNKKKYVYSYWSKFDNLCHEEGVNSKKTKTHFRELDIKITSYVKLLKGTNTTLIITADHGLIDTSKSKIIYLKEHPKLCETLTLPLCGEPRVAYCYVHPSKIKQFENYVITKLTYCCELHKSEDLIEKGLFGLFKPSSKIFDRIGDYILIMKDNYIIKDELLKEEVNIHIGNHGGLSKEEMYVPLVVI